MAAIVADGKCSSKPSLTNVKQHHHRSINNQADQQYMFTISTSSRTIDNTTSSAGNIDSFAPLSQRYDVPLSMSPVLKMNPDNRPTDSTQNLNQNIIITQPTNQASNDFSHHLSDDSKKKICAILSDVETLNDIEKLYLYLQLPDGTNNNNENRGNDKRKTVFNPFGKKTDAEVIQTYTWIQSHLEEDISVSIPKHEVYEDYKAFCEANKFEKLCVADFGKAMKHIFPHVKPRRLGQRGNSKYCYSGLRKKILVDSPELPILDTSEYKFNLNETNDKKNEAVDDVAWNVILHWVEKTFNRKFKNSIDFARHLIDTQDVDISKSLKNNGNVIIKSFATKNHTAKKKDPFNQLHNKKKSQIKKSNDTNGSFEKPFIPANVPAQTNVNSTIHSVCLESINCQTNKWNTENQIKIESDDTAYFASNTSTLSKLPIQQDQSQTIILLTSEQPSSSGSNDPSLNSPTKCGNQMRSPLIDTNMNYKVIQPKELIDYDRKATENDSFPNSDLEIDKRRNSVSANTFNFDSNVKCKIKKEFDTHESFIVDNNDKNYKRQCDEKDLEFMAKKRHIGENLSNMANTIIGTDLNGTSSVPNSDLKVNELETEALYDYLNTNVLPNVFENNNLTDGKECNKDSFVQIRKLLENHLGNNNETANPAGSVESTMSNQLYLEHSNSNSKSTYQFDNQLQNLDIGSNCSIQNSGNTSIQSQVPPSPNTRRHAFNFQPISPRNTPTIPENSTLDMNMFNKATNTNNFNGFNSSSGSVEQQQQQQSINSINVGPSQPASETNSPFVSPRNTPISLCSMPRSRNSSGQSSTYSSTNNSSSTTTTNNNYRATSLQNFDSGVSSISSSPFVSPHSTPIPVSYRFRSLDNANISRNMARVRHSSGPGGPVTNRPPISNIMIYNRSNSLSPMVSDFINHNWCSSQNLHVTLNAAASVDGSVKLFNEDLLNKLNTEENKSNLQLLPFDIPFNTDLNNISFQPKTLQRQRHFSNPYGGAATNSALMKSDENDSLQTLANRSQSVPLNEFKMFQSDLLDESRFNFMDDPISSNSTNTISNGLVGDISKAFPTMHLDNDSFKLPHSTSAATINSNNNHGNDGSSGSSGRVEPNDGFLSSTSIEDLLTNNSIIQSGQDLIVSSVQINQGITSGSGSNDATMSASVDDLNVHSPLMLAKPDRDEFNDLLISDNVVEHFQSLGDFRDCDNDFSNIDLENQTNAYEDVYKFN